MTYRALETVVGPTSDEALQRILAEGAERAETFHALDASRQRYAA